MGKFLQTQNSFAFGELSPDFYSRGDLDIFSRGLSQLNNMDILPSGAISRRCGTSRIAQAPQNGKLIPFSISDTENYLLLLSDNILKIYNSAEIIQEIETPWTTEQIQNIKYAQKFGSIFFVNSEHNPMILKKNGTQFILSDFSFSVNSDMSLNIPFMKFDDADNISISITSHTLGGNFATLTTNENFWTPEYKDGLLFLQDRQWVIYQYISPTQVVAQSNTGYSITSIPISDWKESVFSATRGWPTSITFHQNRLLFGGTKSHPSGVWMSHVGDHHNFNTGSGLDDEAIFLTLLSSERQQITNIISSDNLQILTTTGEWAISAKPLTPTNIDIRQHTSAGSVSSPYIRPQKINRSTIFVSKNRKEVYDMVLDEIGENYTATNLAATASHLIQSPIDMTYNENSRQLFIVMEDGQMAVLSRLESLGISAWAQYTTNGQYKSVAVLDGETFVLTQRGEFAYLEKFSQNETLDSGEFSFTHTATAMPMIISGRTPKKIKVHKITARVINTKSIFINGVRAPIPNETLGGDSPGFSGDTSVGDIGTIADTLKPIWEISGNESEPITILSVSTDGWYLI
ncbi:MAG: hypothetical protein LBL75_02770 [Rickettsiales bacterium]|jgi:hypothetical protein|nr:hypothetical protein [Rickettsiales bacterium]